MKRRTFVLTAGSAGALAVAGCSGNDDDSSADGSSADDGTTDDGTTDGGTTADSGTDDDGTDEDSEPTDDGDDDPQGEPLLAESFQWQDSFVAELRLDREQLGTITIRTNGGNYHQTIETQRGTFEIYNVDDTVYVLQGGSCLRNPDRGIPEPESGIDPQDESDIVGDQPDLSPAGRDTIDGEAVYVYEFTDEDVTLYVSVQAGTIRRVEFPEGRIDYHSWGEVDPIELPEACE